MFNEFLAALPVIALVVFALYGTVFSARSFERERSEMRALQAENGRLREENAALRQRDAERERVIIENRELKAELSGLRLAVEQAGGIRVSDNASVHVGGDVVGRDVDVKK